jgi:hypothetical protein
MGVWQWVAMESLKFHLGAPCPTLLRPAGGPSQKRPYDRFIFGHPTPYGWGHGGGVTEVGTHRWGGGGGEVETMELGTFRDTLFISNL